MVLLQWDLFYGLEAKRLSQRHCRRQPIPKIPQKQHPAPNSTKTKAPDCKCGQQWAKKAGSGLGSLNMWFFGINQANWMMDRRAKNMRAWARIIGPLSSSSCTHVIYFTSCSHRATEYQDNENTESVIWHLYLVNVF